MEGSTKATLIGSIVGIVAAATFGVTGIVLVQQDSAHKIERDRAVKVACIEAGKSLIGGSCVAVQR